MDPMQNAQMHVQESYQKQPNQQQQQQQPPQQNNYQQPPQQQQQQQQQPQQYNQQVKEVRKQSVVKDNNNYGQPQMNDAQAVNPNGGDVPNVGNTMSFAEAQKLNVPNKEAYLHDNEFQQIFGMTKKEFYEQRPWKQKNLKRAKGLF